MIVLNRLYDKSEFRAKKYDCCFRPQAGGGFVGGVIICIQTV